MIGPVLVQFHLPSPPNSRNTFGSAPPLLTPIAGIDLSFHGLRDVHKALISCLYTSPSAAPIAEENRHPGNLSPVLADQKSIRKMQMLKEDRHQHPTLHAFSLLTVILGHAAPTSMVLATGWPV